MDSNPEDTKQKKTIIIVGKTNQGKSTLINTLISPKNGQITPEIQKLLLNAEASHKAVTIRSAIRKVHPSHNILMNDEQLYLIDTPGLEISDDSPFLISEQIDNIIVSERCEIIGICYVTDLANNREVGLDGSSNLQKILQTLKMPINLTKNLLFFILNKWDLAILIKQTDRQKLDRQFKDFVKQKGLAQSRIIRWVNEKQISLIVANMIKDEISDIINKQYIGLREIIRNNIQNKIVLRNDKHSENLINFWGNINTKIMNQIGNIRLMDESSTLNHSFDAKIVQSGLFQKFVRNFGTIISFISHITNIFFYIAKSIKEMDKKDIEFQNIEEKDFLQYYKNFIKKQLYQQIQSKLKFYIISEIMSKIKFQSSCIIFNKIASVCKLKLIELRIYYQNILQKVGDENSPKNILIGKIEGQKLFQKTILNFQNSSFGSYLQNPQIMKEKNIRFYIEIECFMPQRSNYRDIIKKQVKAMFSS